MILYLVSNLVHGTHYISNYVWASKLFQITHIGFCCEVSLPIMVCHVPLRDKPYQYLHPALEKPSEVSGFQLSEGGVS